MIAIPRAVWPYLATLTLASLLSSTAAAMPRVLIFRGPVAAEASTASGPAALAGLADALAIQMRGAAVVEEGPPLEGPDLQARLAQAVRRVVERQATLGLWVEGAPAGSSQTGSFTLLVVGRHPERAVIEAVRLPPGENPDVDRALALKLRDLLDGLLASGPGGPQLPVVLLPARPRAPAPPAVASATEVPRRRSRPQLALLVELGGAVASGAGTVGAQGGGLFGLGLAATWGRWTGEVHAMARIVNDLSVQAARGRVTIEDPAAFLSLHLLREVGRFGLGATVAVGTRVLQASAATPDGRTGSGRRLMPALIVGPEARLRLGRRLALRSSLGAEVALRPVEFEIEQRAVAELGTVRLSGQLSLVISWP